MPQQVHRSGRSVPPQEAGFLSVGGIFTALIVAAIIFAAYKLLPPYINNYQLQDSIETIARDATYSRTPESEIRQQVLSEARDLGINLGEDQVAVSRTSTSVNITAQYRIPVDLLVRQLDLEFSPSAGNRNIVAK
jgi:hypothetical protein